VDADPHRSIRRHPGTAGWRIRALEQPFIWVALAAALLRLSQAVQKSSEGQQVSPCPLKSRSCSLNQALNSLGVKFEGIDVLDDMPEAQEFIYSSIPSCSIETKNSGRHVFTSTRFTSISASMSITAPMARNVSSGRIPQAATSTSDQGVKQPFLTNDPNTLRGRCRSTAARCDGRSSSMPARTTQRFRRYCTRTGDPWHAAALAGAGGPASRCGSVQSADAWRIRLSPWESMLYLACQGIPLRADLSTSRRGVTS